MLQIRDLCRLGVLLVLLVVAMLAVMATIKVDVNGKLVSFREAPRQFNGRIMVPLREMFNALGAEVDWNAANRMIIATRGDIDVQLGVGDHHVLVNGQLVNLDMPVTTIRGVIMIPLRFISEAFRVNVKWYESEQAFSFVDDPPIIDDPPLIAGNGVVPVQYTSDTPDPIDPENEIYNLVAPIALYPDPIVAIMLPACTYLDQVIDAQRMNIRDNERLIDEQSWDISVKSIAHYPRLLKMLTDDPDWATALGQAYVAQPQAVMDAIQALREKAIANGVLQSNPEQSVYYSGDNICIVPIQPDFIYCPEYNPNIVFLLPRSNYNYNLCVFGLGFVIGSWLCFDTDWDHHRVFNHGWEGEGWIARSRSHFDIDRTYTRDKDRPVSVNRNIIQRPINRDKVKNYSLPSRFTPRSSMSTPSMREFGTSERPSSSILRTNPNSMTNARSIPRSAPSTPRPSVIERTPRYIRPSTIERIPSREPQFTRPSTIERIPSNSRREPSSSSSGRGREPASNRRGN